MSLFNFADIQKELSGYLKVNDICRIAKLNKNSLVILYNNDIWEKFTWGKLTEKKIKAIINHPMFRLKNEYKYCCNFYISQLESTIYEYYLFTIELIKNITKKELKIYIELHQYYYLLSEKKDREKMYSYYFNYDNFSNYLQKINNEVLIASLRFDEFYYKDYHVLMQDNKIIVNNITMPANYLQLIKDIECPLEQTIILFNAIRYL